MSYFANGVSLPQLGQWLAALLLAVTAQGARSQAFCASDGRPAPRVLHERFINADCGDCWRQAPAVPARASAALIDWVMPGARGDDAPLSAVAGRDSLARLQALALAEPAAASEHASAAQRPEGMSLRIAHGLALSGYIGVSIEVKSLPQALQGQPLTAWLALVEHLPKGAEGSPVARNLARNMLQLKWDGRAQLSKKEQTRRFESRVMSVPAGASRGRLGLVGWVEDAGGKLLAVAQSRCPPTAP